MQNISLLVSSFHRAPLFKQSLESIIPQLIDGDEIIIVEDSQDEGMKEIVKLIPHNIKHELVLTGNTGYRSGCKAKNIALKLATNPIVIINDPEVIHITPNITITRELLEKDPKLFVVPGTMYAEKDDRSGFSNATKTEHSQAPFIGGIMRKELMAIGGWDERFVYWGNDDNDLMHRLGMNGVKHMVVDTMEAYHQYHDRPPIDAMGDYNESLLYEKDKKIVANEGNPSWGEL